MSKLPEVTDATFKAEVLDSKLPVLVDFWGRGCAPCRAMDPVLVTLAKELDGQMKFFAMDVEKNPATSDELYGIAALPTFIVFKRGRAVSFLYGAANADTMRTFIKNSVDR